MRIAHSFRAVVQSLIVSSALLGTATVVAFASVAPSASAATIAPPKELDFTASELSLFNDPETGKH